jgi:beta-glucosidase
MLLAHGAAVEAYRSVGRNRIGLVVNLEPKDPASTSAEDVAAAERSDIYMNRHFLDPALLGRYPERLADLYGDAWPHRGMPDLGRVRQPMDFLGINYYKRGVMRRDDARAVERAVHAYPPGRPYTELRWEVHPEALTRTLCWVKDTYGDIPLYVTENGAAFADPPRAEAEVVEDPARVDYLRGHLLAAHEAIRRGVDLRGYFVWSLLDNFEWSQGFSKRFGIVHVDYASQQRTLKRSGLFYRDVVRSNGAALGVAAQA